MRKQEKNNPPHLCQRRQRRTRLTVRTGGPEGEDISRKWPHRAQPGGFLSMKKGGVFDKDTHLSSCRAHAIRLFRQPKRALSRGSSMDSARRAKTDRKRRMETRRVRRKTRGFRPKSSAFFRKVPRFCSVHGNRAIRKRDKNECTLPTMGEEMPTTPRPSRDFIGKHRRNEELYPIF